MPSTCPPSSRTVASASPSGASSSAPSALTRTWSSRSEETVMSRGYGAVGSASSRADCELPELPTRTRSAVSAAGSWGEAVGVRAKVRETLTVLYEHRLARALKDADKPRHVGVIIDGNRRWARAIGLEDVSEGHRRGAGKIVDFLGWCDEAGVEVVTIFL